MTLHSKARSFEKSSTTGRTPVPKGTNSISSGDPSSSSPSFEAYVGLVSDSARRSRFLAYLLSVAIALSFAIMKMKYAPDWTYLRMQLYRDAYHMQLPEYKTGQLNLREVRNPAGVITKLKELLEVGPNKVGVIQRLQEVLDLGPTRFRRPLDYRLVEGMPDSIKNQILGVHGDQPPFQLLRDIVCFWNSNQLDPKEIKKLLPDDIRLRDEIDTSILNQFESSSRFISNRDLEATENGWMAAGSGGGRTTVAAKPSDLSGYDDEGLLERMKALESRYAASRTVTVPLVSVEFDTYDLPQVIGIALIVLVVLLTWATSREQESVELAMRAKPTIEQLDFLLCTESYSRTRGPWSFLPLVSLGLLAATLAVFYKIAQPVLSADPNSMYYILLGPSRFTTFQLLHRIIFGVLLLTIPIAMFFVIRLNLVLTTVREHAFMPVLPWNPSDVAAWFDALLRFNRSHGREIGFPEEFEGEVIAAKERWQSAIVENMPPVTRGWRSLPRALALWQHQRVVRDAIVSDVRRAARQVFLDRANAETYFEFQMLVSGSPKEWATIPTSADESAAGLAAHPSRRVAIRS